MSNELIEEIFESDAIPPISLGLPTLGRFYDEDMLDVDADPTDLLVRPLSIVDEQNFRDPFLLSTGKALPKMIRNTCPGILKPADLAEIDVEALLIAIRIVSFGSHMNIKHICQNPALKDGLSDETAKGKNLKDEDIFKCRAENPIDVDLNEFILRYAPFTDEMFEKFRITLGRVGQTVMLRPMPYSASVEMMMKTIKTQTEFERFAENNSEEDVAFDEDMIEAYSRMVNETNQTNVKSLADSILNVTTRSGIQVSDRDKIRDWLTSIPIEDAHQITDRVNEIMLSLKELNRLTYQCPSCGYENTIYVQMDPQKLFTLAEDSGTPEKSSASSTSTGKKGSRRSRISQK